ncbi:hypothetical protein Kpol_1058p21 [Vanderwaltozyma polyspora DSM 70294]|uniref:Fatty acid hydroxylase domain-containing protein n=1 Tax=Vanderwaltozyma polyspora (strain ATCC 22028 / DSM 70294 / BCRC 21397 / CBS 2163 / NBRC 10782 / NRRL Y-8283 / UCD 57-17) TaxID=436907 RepID=A7TJQ5_VANPO|nr:uncharacterized protein Kpol_1058p21 [Vanderwaltozyma polyspora DSM 70294]EDO17484.1 hypothetical protein Kpol_1058p21 [Vanderwaltozyma polyspora DSM 70294]
MDLILEVADTFLLDHVYAKVLPTSLASYVPVELMNKFNLNSGMANATMLLDHLNSNRESRVCSEVYGYTPYLTDMTMTSFQSLLPRSNMLREFLSVWMIVTVFGWLLYFSVAYFSYLFIFDRSVFNHPRYLKNQMMLEIKLATSSIPWMSFLTSFCFSFELKGHSKLYTVVDFEKNGLRQIFGEIVLFILFTDCGVYLAHRWLHWPRVYKALHKPHHKWLVCTPFASHAFHPVDGYIQSLPYHIYPLLMPLNKYLYLFLFTFVNFWTIMIHDANHMYNNPYVNGTACHTVHHLYFNYNYGQFTTLWDRLGGSYRRPEDELFDPDMMKDKKSIEEQLKRVDAMQKEVEGDDEREYNSDNNASEKKNN